MPSPVALVTGATGFLGWHVARALTERGFRVRALCRPASRVRELEVESITGDLRDPESLARAVHGCQFVFHVAADYRLWSKNPQELYDSNVTGTRNVLEAAARAGVERIVYTSTVGCIGMPKQCEGDEATPVSIPQGDEGTPVSIPQGDEGTPVSIKDMSGHYKRSKWLAEQLVLEKARAGLPVVIVNPTAPIGDHDWKPTPTGKIIVDFLRGKLPAFIDTGLNLIDVRDTALGHLLAAERGRPGERYILGSENLTLEQILVRLAAIANKPAPKTKLPYAVAYAAGVLTTSWANLTGHPPLAPLEGVRMARKKMFVSNAKAVRELGFAPGPVNLALERAVRWFHSNRYC